MDLQNSAHDWLQLVPKNQLPALWNKFHSASHTSLSANYSKALADVQAMTNQFSHDWSGHMLTTCYTMDPELAAFEYSLSEIIIWELLQSFYSKQNKDSDGSVVFQFIEGMSGQRALSKALLAKRLNGVSLDRRYDSCLDFATINGFKVFMMAARKLAPFGLFWWGIECKTWVWVCRSSTGRTSQNPMGSKENPSTQEANLVMQRFVFMAQVLYWGRRAYVLEQPLSSLLFTATPIKILCEVHSCFNVRCDHGFFDEADAPCKPLKLLGVAPWLVDLRVVLPRHPSSKRTKLSYSKTKTLADGSQKQMWYGIKDKMHDSEHYCDGFGSMVAQLQKQWMEGGSSSSPMPQIARCSTSDSMDTLLADFLDIEA
jgi:hypothetical protein